MIWRSGEFADVVTIVDALGPDLVAAGASCRMALMAVDVLDPIALATLGQRDHGRPAAARRR